MYYAEEVINGILCFQTIPNGKWTELTKEQLTERLVKAVKECCEMADIIAEGL